MNLQKTYLAIDLKSFYASVECIDRNLDPMNTNLVVADASRTEKTICLAATPAIKSFGVSGRARLFEVIQKVKEVNQTRRILAPKGKFTGKSHFLDELKNNPSLEMTYIAAPPRMARYMEVSTQIYQIYLKYAAPEDIHVYSIDEVFIDITPYLRSSGMNPKEYATTIVQDVFQTTHITATVGIGTNLYLAKVAMDIVAKHTEPNEHGVRMAQLNELTYRTKLWDHQPLTDFWRIGRGYAKKLEENGLYTMGDIAKCSIGKANEFYNEDLLYHLFGINAELLIDHAWGWEPCTMKDIKSYQPVANSLGTGQVLHCAYTAKKGRLISQEMAEQLSLDLVEKCLVTSQIVLTVGYDIENLTNSNYKQHVHQEVKVDFYGRKIPKHAHGTIHIDFPTASTKKIVEAVTTLYDRIVDPQLLVRRINITACNVLQEDIAKLKSVHSQISLFSDFETLQERSVIEDIELKKENSLQKTIVSIKKKYGKNKILKLMNKEEGATMIQRNEQIGGHRA
ncbi:MAG: DNA methylase [Erysipelotrichaceae bacterium]|nr:DNA methylase [Erysipelotrichaceae bacterium]